MTSRNKPSRPLHSDRTSRRQFLKAIGAVGVVSASPAAWAGPAAFSYRRPGEQLNVACIGVGGMGGSDLASISSASNVNIVALCDVDANNLGAAAKKHATAKTFTDWRMLLDEMHKDIDAVSVSTPDHMHAPIALSAMSLGKHVYCQKPIAHSLHECRAMTKVAARQKVVTQMGTQIHSQGAYRTAVATLQSGVIGKVTEAHLWVSKSWAGPAAGRPAHTDAIPDTLDWNLWLGVAPERPFVKDIYHAARWRGWKDFGCGTLGDMGCHIFDPVFTALGIGSPSKVVSRGPAHFEESFAADSDVNYEFPATRYTKGKLKMRWTDGNAGSRPDASRAQLPEGVSLPGAGSFLVGEKGVMVIPHWSAPRFYSKGEVMDAKVTEMPNLNHYHEWADACRGEGESSTPFSYSGPLTEAVLAGTIAGRFPDRELNWDAARLSFG
ncbi:MAG: putative dehydrogenase, partial [Planctomycetota bacterium]